MKTPKARSFISLDKKLVGVVFFVSIFFMLVWSLSSLYFQAKTDAGMKTKDLQYFQSVILPAVESSVWKVDQEQARVQLQGLLVNPEVIRVRIEELGNSKFPFLDIGKTDSYSSVKETTYALKAPFSEGGRHFANMTVYMTKDPMMARLKSEAIRYFASETIEVFVLSLLLLWAFRYLVLKHLRQISLFLKNNSVISKSTPHLDLKASSLYPDEIDTLVDALNRTIDESKNHQIQIEDLKDRAEKANQSKSLFLASINHELRTPLNAILGVTEILPQSLGNPAEVNQLLEMQKRSGIHLLHLVDEILDFSKIEAGQVHLEYQPTDLRKGLETCKDILNSAVEERGNKIEFWVDPSFPESVEGDPHRINQIILNLASNANKFTDRGLISVQLRHVEGQVEILVKDTGKGIPENKLEEIFLPFRQLDNQPNESRKGTGIGLPITKRLVELMKGKIHVDSKLGLGSVFTVRLPLKVSAKREKVAPAPLRAAPLSPPPQTPQEEASPARRVKLLVVEDTPEVQMLIRAYLKGTNIEVSFAENGEEGIHKFEEDDPAMILMDLQMPVMNGFEATQKIREMESRIGNHHVRILALTALATKGDLERAMQSGCDGYVTKPFSRSKLLESLKEGAGLAS